MDQNKQNINMNGSFEDIDDKSYIHSPRTTIFDTLKRINGRKTYDNGFDSETSLKEALPLKKAHSMVLFRSYSTDNVVRVRAHSADAVNVKRSKIEETESYFGISTIRRISTVVGSLKSLHDSWRESERNRRLSNSLILLKQAKIDLEISRSPESRKLRIDNLTKLGGLGVALFSPLDPAFGYDDVSESNVMGLGNDAMGDKNNLIAIDVESVTTESSDFDDDDSLDVDPIIVAKESPSTLLESPYILSNSLMRKIANTALPNVLQGMAWKRLYSLSRDGDSFQTFLRNVKYHSNTLIVVRTTKDNIFGGLADSEWGQRKTTTQKNYFGTGRSFLFSVSQDANSHCHLNTYRWAGNNNYNQICDASEERIAMGGGGVGFGLCLQNNFARGSTEHCATFCNDPLVPDGYFEVLQLEVYGFIYPWKLV